MLLLGVPYSNAAGCLRSVVPHRGENTNENLPQAPCGLCRRRIHFIDPPACPAAHAQGCVAAHSPQPIIAGLNPTSQFGSHSFANGEWLHNLTLTVGYRAYNSFRHYVGTEEQVQREINKNAIVNHVNLFELDVNYQVTPRLSVIASCRQ